MGRLRFINRWMPPPASTTSEPGCRLRCSVLANISWRPCSSATAWSTYLSAAFVATATNPGVSGKRRRAWSSSLAADRPSVVGVVVLAHSTVLAASVTQCGRPRERRLDSSPPSGRVRGRLTDNTVRRVDAPNAGIGPLRSVQDLEPEALGELVLGKCAGIRRRRPFVYLGLAGPATPRGSGSTLLLGHRAEYPSRPSSLHLRRVSQ